MFNRSRALMAAAMMMGLSTSPAMLSAPIPTPIVNVSKRTKRGFFNGRASPNLALLMGWRSVRLSVAQGKRNAVKHRRQQRNKRACRG